MEYSMMKKISGAILKDLRFGVALEWIQIQFIW